MKQALSTLLIAAIEAAQGAGVLPAVELPPIEVSEPRVAEHGDLATNLALAMAKACKAPPRKVAEAIVAHLQDPQGIVAQAQIAGPGFINFFLSQACWHRQVVAIHAAGEHYGRSSFGAGQRVQVEYVSSNPTGPLHIGHGRGAAVGDSLARILTCCGFEVQKEYYINDSGRQIRTLGRSVWLRYRELFGFSEPFPEECYQGDYIRDYALRLKAELGDGLLQTDPEQAMLRCARRAAADILEWMRRDLVDFGVTYDCWFSEQSLYDNGQVQAALEELRQRGLIYQHEGAQWFRSTALGDEKDRVVVRQNGQTTYFASDIAYHRDKFRRGFERVIDVWGADHHGYIPRVTAAVEALGQRRDQFQVVLVQLVNLLRGGEPVAMSTRAGEFVTLAEVVNEVGRDAARFLFLTRHHDSPLDFDLELAKRQSNDNPVYYVQYVHARICSIARKAEQSGASGAAALAAQDLAALTAAEEIQLIKHLAAYPETVALAARNLEPHRVAFHLLGLAAAFHAYYNKHRVLAEDPELTRARLCLVLAVRQVIRNGLTLLGVSAPESM